MVGLHRMNGKYGTGRPSYQRRTGDAHDRECDVGWICKSQSQRDKMQVTGVGKRRI